MAAKQQRRLPEGGRIDRARPLDFRFDGRALSGYVGDTLASALLANGVDVVGRSFKFARRRGIVGAGAEEPNAIVAVGDGARTTPNQRATQVALRDGLLAQSSRAHPLKRIAGLAAGLMPAGFYYKTFMGGRRGWLFWERVLRGAAGLGDAPPEGDEDVYDHMNQHADVLVVGGGPAGLAAALEAARAGARVLLADEQTELGGSLLASTTAIGDGDAARWLAEALAELDSLGALLLPRTTVFGNHGHGFFTALETRFDQAPADSALSGNASRQRLHRIRARQTVLAAGAVERPIVFANNDLPGVMLASAVRVYVNRYAVAAGSRLLLFTANDDAYRTAIDWQSARREVVAVVDARAQVEGEWARRARAAGIEVIAGHGVVEAFGGKRVTSVSIAPVEGSGGEFRPKGPSRRLACDLVACSGGWSPALHLSSHTGAKPVWDERAAAFLPDLPSDAGQDMVCVGAAAGAWTLDECLRQGAAAGAEAASRCGFGSGRAHGDVPFVDEPPQADPAPLFRVHHTRPASRAPHQFVDLQMDATAADIELAAREGYRSVEHVKRYTGLGFGTDQGKLGNVNGVAILASALGARIEDTGTTMFRPPYTPTTFGAVAGRSVGDLFDPERRTAMHEWHAAHGAVWEDVGRWKRPRYYPQAGETMDEAVRRECLAARQGVAMLDASTLGKIDVQGANAAEFLQRVYAGNFRKLRVGRCRYGLMLREDGTIFDDGVAARLNETRYLIHTTTGNAEAVFAWLELWRQTEWPELDVHLTSVTDHWATAALVGPRSREVLRKVAEDVDVDALPFMAVCEGRVAGVAARIFRISFSGELSFEVNVPAQHGHAVWEALVDAGTAFGVTPYGTEAMHVLRAEKGFIIVGQDTDGSMTPDDMGLGWAVGDRDGFGFIGDRSLALADHQREDRLQFVGLKPAAPALVLAEGAQLVASADGAGPSLGHVTSSYFSAALERSIALAMLKAGRTRIGEAVFCKCADEPAVPAEVVGTVFYDPQGKRQRV